jgi:hypothetical protein
LQGGARTGCQYAEEKWSELLRVHYALTKAEYPVSKEKIHFILTYCHILKISEEDKMKHIATKAMSE